jgi:hypothetical protein
VSGFGIGIGIEIDIDSDPDSDTAAEGRKKTWSTRAAPMGRSGTM